MNKRFYTFGNIFLGMSIFASALNSLIHFLIGERIFRLQSYTDWFLIANMLSLAANLFILKYYQSKGYTFAFVTGIMAALANACLAFVIYQLLSFDKEFIKYHIPSLLVTLVISLIYASSLVWSDTAKHRLLKTAGVLGIISAAAILSLTVLFTVTADLQLKTTVVNIINGISWISGLIPLLFIAHFKNEAALMQADVSNTNQIKFSESWLGFASISALGILLYLGYNIAVQSYESGRISKADRLSAERFEARIFISQKGDTLQYRLMKPLNPDAEKMYPLVVCLHGGAGWGTENIRQVAGSLPAQMLSETEIRKKYPAFLFVPQCAEGFSWGGLPNHTSVEELVFEAMEALEEELNIDKKRRYVSGNSLGGYGTWHFICARPDLFAAAIPISGAGDPKFGSKITDVPVWAFHGVKDKNVPVAGSRDIIASMKKAGGNPQYSEYPDAGHDIWRRVINTPGLLDWLFAQQKK